MYEDYKIFVQVDFIAFLIFHMMKHFIQVNVFILLKVLNSKIWNWIRLWKYKKYKTELIYIYKTKYTK